LITDHVEELTRLCEFIGVPYHEAMLRYPEVSTYEYPDQSLVMQWRNKLTEWEIQLVESRVGNMLVERGYQLSKLPKLSTAGKEFRLRLQDWWGRKQFRLKRYGLPLILSDFLARRFGLKQWQKQTQLKLNSIETIYLK
jgi:hypothetical protein